MWSASVQKTDTGRCGSPSEEADRVVVLDHDLRLALRVEDFVVSRILLHRLRRLGACS
jgi:hypothetical protein